MTHYVFGPGHAAAADLLGVQDLLEVSDREVDARAESFGRFLQSRQSHEPVQGPGVRRHTILTKHTIRLVRGFPTMLSLAKCTNTVIKKLTTFVPSNWTW